MLAVTLQDSMLSVSFEAPLSSLGAPEDPQNAEDEARIEAMLEDFRNDETIISLQGDAGCEIVSTSTGTAISTIVPSRTAFGICSVASGTLASTATKTRSG